MRPFTAETNEISLPATIRWRNRSSSPKEYSEYDEKQVRTFMLTSNISAFIDSSTMKLETSNATYLNGKKEVLDQLTFIKSKFNLTAKRHSMGDAQLKELEKNSNEKKLEEQRAIAKLSFLSEKTKKLYNGIEDIKKKQQAAEEDMLIYIHILERAKLSQFFFEIKANKLKQDLRRQNVFVESEQRLRFKSRESRTSSQRIYRILYKSVITDKQEKHSIINKLSKDLDLRGMLNSKREERKRRFLEISEIAANEDRDKKETYLREGLILNRLWTGFLLAKLKNETKTNSSVELAFQKIRVVTGEYNVIELVHKFLTREQTFKELKQTIEYSKSSIQETKTKNQEIEKIINATVVFDKESKINDVFILRERLAQCLKQLETSSHKLNQFQAIYEHVIEWNKRMAKLFQVNSENAKNFKEHFIMLSSVIISMMPTVKKNIQTLIIKKNIK